MMLRIATATICAFLAVGILCALGSWQIQRLVWKEAIIADLNRLYAEDAAQSPINLQKLQDQDAESLHYGFVEGRFLFEKEILLEPKILKGVSGYHVITPLLTQSGHNILVNRGWVKDKPAMKKQKGSYKVSGMIRKPDWTPFTSQNSPDNNRWFRADIKEIGSVKGLENLVPFMVYAENISPALDGPILQAKKWYPKNNHKPYAIFWFSMAFIACAFYAAFVLSQAKGKRG